MINRSKDMDVTIASLFSFPPFIFKIRSIFRLSHFKMLMAFYFAHLNFKRGVFNHYPNLSRKRKRDSSGDHSCRRLAISSCNNFFAVGFGNGFVVLYSRVRGMSFVNVGLSCFSKWPVRGIILLDSSRLYVAYGNGDVFRWENPVGDMSTHIRICKGDMAIDGSLLDFSGTRTHWVGLYSGWYIIFKI